MSYTAQRSRWYDTMTPNEHAPTEDKNDDIRNNL